MAHEDLGRHEEVEGSSDRSFGFVFAVVFLIVAAWPLLSSNPPRWWSVGVSAAFAAIAMVRPVLLAGLNRYWMKFGLLLSRIVSPIALGLLYYLAFTPIGLLMRMTGKDPLRLKKDPGATTYWQSREPPGPRPDSMTQQF